MGKSHRTDRRLACPATHPSNKSTDTHTTHKRPEMEGLGTYFCSGVKDRGEHERPRVTVKLAFDR